MAQEIEIEFKNLLTKKEFDRLQAALFSGEKAFSQVNYYFETADFKLAEKSSALRIRKKENHFELTLKEPHPEGLLETHDSLADIEVLKWKAGKPTYKENVGERLNALGIATKELQFVGHLTTVRIEKAYKDTLIVLDHSTYNGTEDFEFELEANSREYGGKVFNEILDNYEISRKETPNKIRRFFTSLKEKR